MYFSNPVEDTEYSNSITLVTISYNILFELNHKKIEICFQLLKIIPTFYLSGIFTNET